MYDPINLNPAPIRALIAAGDTGPAMIDTVADDVVRAMTLDAPAGEEVQR